jgi:hypothetical protein
MPRKDWKGRCNDLETQNRALRNQIDYLVRTIRDMDDKIFSIGQFANGTWNEPIRVRFAQLHDGMTARKVNESNAIGRVIEERLHEVYKPESEALKQITKK